MSTKAASVLRRALLYVPASSPRFLQKSLALNVDSIAYDLEDSVTPSQKPDARKHIASFLSSLPTGDGDGGGSARRGGRPAGIGELGVRINAVSSGLALDDLTVVLAAPHLDVIVVPKVNSAADLHFVHDVLRHTLPQRHPSTHHTPSPADTNAQQPIKILALIESATAILNLPEICRATPYLSGLIFAAEDFALDMSLTRTVPLTEFLYARSAIATAARAYDLPSTIDLVCTRFRGDDGLRAVEDEALAGRGLGFNGKQCIHPTQVDVVQKAFAPGGDEVEWATRVVIADEKADAVGRGAWTLDGKMIDAPVVGKAKATVKRAELCGFDIGSIRETWKDQEPE